MRKKIFIIAGFIGLVILALATGSSEKIIEENIEIVEVKRDIFTYDYKTFGIVDSKSHYLFFNGYIKTIYKKMTEGVKKNDRLISYVNEHGSSKDLLSDIDGFIYRIENNCITIKDLDYFIVVELAYEKYILLKENDSCFIVVNGNSFSAAVIEKVRYDNQDDKYKVIIKTDYKELIFSQHVNVIFYLQQKEGLTVDKRALNHDSEGYYLIDEKFKDELKSLQKYRIDIEVIMSNDKLALISAIGLENRKVCILSDYLKEFLGDQIR
ncbi:MAG TPA: hypothetical protein PK631_02045 [Erysipelotrichaceae bacterium]|nr:hypothetical protein [Erysipelotrichaceae bacterium]